MKLNFAWPGSRSIAHVSSETSLTRTARGAGGLDLAGLGITAGHAIRAIRLTRRVRPLRGTGTWKSTTIYTVHHQPQRRPGHPAELAGWIRGHWRIEARHHIRDVTYGEDALQVRTGAGPGHGHRCAVFGCWAAPWSQLSYNVLVTGLVARSQHVVVLPVYLLVWSSISAPGAFLFTESIPLRAAPLLS